MNYVMWLFSFVFSLTSFAQSSKYAGNYEVRDHTDNAIIEYKLTLKSDGTFLFHLYENHVKTSPQEKNKFGKGNWKAEHNIVSFTSDAAKELDKNYTLNFSNTKARIDKISPSTITKEIVPVFLRFYDSDIFWVKGMKLSQISN